MYDDNGSMTEGHYKGIVTAYNHLVLPVYIAKGGDSILMTYDAGGTLLRKQHKSGSTVVMTRDYIGGMEYVNDTLDAIYHSEGKIKYIDEVARYEYHIRDHLGNIRLTYSDLNADGLITTPDEIVEEMHYYAYGMMMEGSWMGSSGQYGYNGIEYENFLDLEMNLATYRGLDPTLGRWWQVDPKAESSIVLSQYNSMSNNPISNVDPNGDSPILIGAAIGFLSNGIQNVASGNNFFSGGLKAAAFGAIGGGISSGIGSAAQSLANTGASKLGVGAFQAGAHALTGGLQSVAQGGNFLHGAASGGLSSAVGSVIAASDGGATAQWIGGGVSGGVGSMIAGGSFMSGAAQGLITGGLNHAADQIEYLLTKKRLISLLRKEGRCTDCTDQEVGRIFQNEIVAPSLIKEGIPIIPGEALQTIWGNTIPDFFYMREGTQGSMDMTGLIEVKAKYSGSRVGLFSQNGQIFKQLLGLSTYMASKGYSGGKHAIITTGGVKVSGSIGTFGRRLGIKVHHFQSKYSGSLSSRNIIFR